MQEAVYKSRVYIILVDAYISFLLYKNGFKVIVNQDIYGAALMTIQAIVLYQIYLKHEYVKLGIKIWTAFPIVKEGVFLGINLLWWIEGGHENIDPASVRKSIFFFLAALFIFFSCDYFIKVENDKEEEADEKILDA